MKEKQSTADYMVKKLENKGFNQALTNLEKYDRGEYKPRPIEEIEKVISLINGKK